MVRSRPRAAMLVIVGIAAQTVTTTTNSFVQLSAEPAMRGRDEALISMAFIEADAVVGVASYLTER